MTQTTHSDAAVLDALREVINHASVGTVFGEPLDQDGVTVLPAAKVSGGGGGGTAAEGSEPKPGGTGGGLGLSARPMGVFVIKEGRVSWRPAVDVNKIIIGGQIVAVVGLLVLRSLIRRRHRTEGSREAGAPSTRE